MTMTVNEAGRLGGLSLSQKQGRDHFSQIGKKGQQVMRQRHPGKASEWGKMGGRPKKLSLKEMGEAKK
jgi:general stress protein YciG